MNHIEEIVKIELLEKNLQAKKDEIYQDYAKKCPYKIGEIVKIKGYSSHYNKMGKITGITAKKHYSTSMHICWVITGRVLKVDGSESCYIFEVDEWQESNK